MGQFFVKPDGVHQLGQVWSQAGEGLHEQVHRIHADRLEPAHFGMRYADEVGGVTAAFDKLEGTWRGWGDHCSSFSSHLHSAADSFRAADQV